MRDHLIEALWSSYIVKTERAYLLYEKARAFQEYNGRNHDCAVRTASCSRKTSSPCSIPESSETKS
ncbi:hypothetical protein D3H55_04900 [Bacillus salacetis]|uniref:Uncharacterized protein n=1 Tax=Bacillus salacetis TaxID=2315464 RepID=A0A3A1R4A3_9BACI|nr:hypothetical protein D3H55_04900 [Bacillus salacetis]